MDNYIYYRVVGSVVTLSLLSVYSLSCSFKIRELLPTHPELQIFNDLGPRYNTVWNMVFVNVYASVSLLCDISTIRKTEKYVHPTLRVFRFKIFHEVIFPQVVGMIIYWPIFFYDRELVFPTVVDILITPFGNFVFHGLGIVYVFCELIFLPRNVPDRNILKNTHLLCLNGVYLVVLLYTRYVDLGVWMYGVLTATAGTILFPIILFSMSILSNIAFYVQWNVKDYVWSLRTNCKGD